MTQPTHETATPDWATLTDQLFLLGVQLSRALCDNALGRSAEAPAPVQKGVSNGETQTQE